MAWNKIEGNWKQLAGNIKERWGRLTDDDLLQINGKREILEGKIQAHYGWSPEETKRDVEDWFNTHKDGI